MEGDDTKVVKLAAVLCGLSSAAAAAPVTYDGITFPQGDLSFADALVSYDPGTPTPTNSNFTDGTAALGPPDYSGGGLGTGAVSLSQNGSITLRFVDNRLTGSGTDMPDLYIFEVGPAVEGTTVEISMDGNTFFSIGGVSGSTASIDIDAFGFGTSDSFAFVRLTDDGTNAYGGGTPGPDIDAVGAISSVAPPPTAAVPLPAAGWMLLGAITGMGAIARRRRG